MDTPTEDRRVQLRQAMPIFGGIRADILQYLLQLARQRGCPKGDYYYHEGDAADSLFVLEGGKVLLLKRWQGDDYKLKLLEKGACFGQVALIDLQPRNTSALAIEASSAIELSDADFHMLYRKDIEQFVLIRMNMAREVCRMDEEVDEMHRAVYELLKREMRENPDSVEDAVSALTVSRSLLRLSISFFRSL